MSLSPKNKGQDRKDSAYYGIPGKERWISMSIETLFLTCTPDLRDYYKSVQFAAVITASSEIYQFRPQVCKRDGVYLILVKAEDKYWIIDGKYLDNSVIEKAILDREVDYGDDFDSEPLNVCYDSFKSHLHSYMRYGGLYVLILVSNDIFQFRPRVFEVTRKFIVFLKAGDNEYRTIMCEDAHNSVLKEVSQRGLVDYVDILDRGVKVTFDSQNTDGHLPIQLSIFVTEQFHSQNCLPSKTRQTLVDPYMELYCSDILQSANQGNQGGVSDGRTTLAQCWQDRPIKQKRQGQETEQVNGPLALTYHQTEMRNQNTEMARDFEEDEISQLSQSMDAVQLDYSAEDEGTESE